MHLMVTNHSSAVDMGVMLGRVAVCFKAGQEEYDYHRMNIIVCSSFSDRRNVLVVVVFEDDNSAPVLIGLVPTVGDLVAPLLHLDALPIVAGELTPLATRQLQHCGIGLAIVAFF